MIDSGRKFLCISYQFLVKNLSTHATISTYRFQITLDLDFQDKLEVVKNKYKLEISYSKSLFIPLSIFS